MNSFFEFFSLAEPGIRTVVLGTTLLSVSTSLVGCFTLLRKRALAGDAVAHAVLPGLCVAFILQETKNPFYLMIGAFISGWLALSLIDFITQKTRIKEDTAIGLILSGFFGVGTLLLSIVQNRMVTAEKSGLKEYLFGSATSINSTDIYSFGIVAIILVIVVALFYKEFQVLSFDQEYTESIGFRAKRLQLILTTLIVFAVVIGVRAVGVVLMAAMLITPGAAGRYWTNSLPKMLAIAVLIGLVSGLSGTYISYASGHPTGPWIVMILSVLAIISFMVAPKKGILQKLIKQRHFKRKIREENILKALYHLGEEKADYTQAYSYGAIMGRRPMHKDELSKGLKSLTRHGFLSKKGEKYTFTDAGFNQGMRITRLHRLWELYLTRNMKIASDHVHDEAETIEHIITPEIEKELEKELDFPEMDPHQTKIPYRQ